MTFWILVGAMTLVVALLLAMAFRSSRKDAVGPAAAYDLRVYRDQLREVEKDLARGVVSDGDAERVRAEISRRILAADTKMRGETDANETARGAPGLMAGLVGVALVAGSFGIYMQLGAPGYGDLSLEARKARAEEARENRPDQAAAEARIPAAPTGNASPDYIALVEQLRDTVAERPGDLQGQVLLARSEAALGNFAAAARAQEQILRIKGTEATDADYADYADMLVVAAGGYVSPEAEAAARAALALAPGNGTARYYLGLMFVQTGRPDRGFRIWDQLLRAGPPDAPWISPVLTQIEDVARRAGVTYQMPEIGGGRGPSQADISAAADMSPTDRLSMIEGMVAGLSDRLATEGGTAQDWAQLISALGVLERRAEAAAIFANAQEVFADDPTAIDLLTRAGQRAGVAE